MRLNSFLGGCVAALAFLAHAADEAPPPLAFADFYKRPVGPRGLEASDRLRAASNTRVSLSGYVVREPTPAPTRLILAPLPITLGDEDEAQADDLPASVAYLHTDDPELADAMRRCRGAVQVAGRIELGPRRESDERLSYVRLAAESAQCKDH
jgi:hypothetical protein